MTKIFAVDPGSEHSGWVVYDASARRVLAAGNETPNLEVASAAFHHGFGAVGASRIHGIDGDKIMAIEVVQPMGQPLYGTVVQTAVWTGRMIEAFKSPARGSEWFAWNPPLEIRRTEVKRRLLGSTKGSDAQVTAVLCDIHGGSRPAAIGTIKKPGPLYTVKGHAWAALAVAVVAADIVNESLDTLTRFLAWGRHDIEASDPVAQESARRGPDRFVGGMQNHSG